MAKTIINRLSDRLVRTAPPGMHSDGAGLYLRVTTGSGGAQHRYWIFRYAHRATGKDRQLGIGPLDTIGLADARAKAQECRKLLLGGIDPVEHRRSREAAAALQTAKTLTFDEAVAAYIAAHRPTWSSQKHCAQWASTLKTYVTPVFGHLPVGAIDDGLVLKALESIWTTKPETASRVRGRIESVLDWAKVRGFRTGENPARWRGHLSHLLPAKTKMRKGKVNHHAALPYTRVGEFMAELRSRPGIPPRALEFAILTASRSDEVLGARWEEIDWATSTWSIPAERMKGRAKHCVPLSDPALAILRAMQVVGGAAGYVFPGRPGRQAGNMTLLWAIWRMNEDRKAAGLPMFTDPHQGNREVTPHGFRSTFRDWAGERTGHAREICEKALAHTLGDETERAYQRGELLDKRRRLMADWATFCSMAPADYGDVVPLHKGISA
jgi:integrase